MHLHNHLIKTLFATELAKRTITGIILAFIAVTVLLYAPIWIFSFIMIVVTAVIIAMEWTLLFNYKTLAFWLILPIYPIFPLALIIFLHQQYSYIITLLLFCLVAAHDVGSYFAGKLAGKHKICPSISPGKTWQGFAGGYIFTFTAALIFFRFVNQQPPILFIFLFTLLISCSALLGDLFESYLKRRIGLKDSGTLLPGHGGLLDRLDGVMFAVFVIYLFREHLQKLL